MPGLKFRILIGEAIRSISTVMRRRSLFAALAFLAAPALPFASRAMADQGRGIVYLSLEDFCMVMSYKDGVAMDVAQLTSGGGVVAATGGTQITFEEERRGLMGILGGLDHTKRTSVFRFDLPAGNYVIHSFGCTNFQGSKTFNPVSKEKRSIWESLTKGPAPVDPRAGVGYFTVAANEVAAGGSLNVANLSTLTVRPLNALEISYIKQVYPAEGGKIVYRPVMQLPLFMVAGAGAKAPPTDAAAAWNAIKNSKDLEQVKAFRRKYGNANPLYDDLAKKRIDAIKAASPGLATKSPFNMPASPRAIVAGRSVGPVMLGMTQAQVEGVLGEPGKVSSYDDGTMYLNYYSGGLSILLKNGKVSCIFVYTGRADRSGAGEFSRYNGLLPAGLGWDSTLAHITAKLGEPMDSHTFQGDRYTSYDEGMSFVFNETGQMSHVTVQAPR